MYPKSPFNLQKSVYIHPKDDQIMNYNINKIKNQDDKNTFLKIKTNIEKISLQLYNLRISKECCKINPMKSGCSTNQNDVNVMISELNSIKMKLHTKAKEMILFYSEDTLEVTSQ